MPGDPIFCETTIKTRACCRRCAERNEFRRPPQWSQTARALAAHDQRGTPARRSAVTSPQTTSASARSPGTRSCVLSYAQSHHDLGVSCQRPRDVLPGHQPATRYYPLQRGELRHQRLGLPGVHLPQQRRRPAARPVSDRGQRSLPKASSRREASRQGTLGQRTSTSRPREDPTCTVPPYRGPQERTARRRQRGGAGINHVKVMS